MELSQILIPIGATIGGTVLVSFLAATLPESAAWSIGRWLDLWAWCRAGRPEVRERLADIEEDFWHCYRVERADGSGTTRATFRAIWLVIWEVIRAGEIAGSVDRLVATEFVGRKSRIRIFAESIAKLLGIRNIRGPVFLLLVGSPIVIHMIILWSGVYRINNPEVDLGALEIALKSLTIVLHAPYLIGRTAKTQFRGFSAIRFLRSVPSILANEPLIAVLLAGYYVLLTASYTVIFGLSSLSNPGIIAVFVVGWLAILWPVVKVVKELRPTRAKSSGE